MRRRRLRDGGGKLGPARRWPPFTLWPAAPPDTRTVCRAAVVFRERSESATSYPASYVPCRKFELVRDLGSTLELDLEHDL